MKQKKVSELSDEELLLEAKKMKSSSLINALFIGTLIGIVIYSFAKNGFGFFIFILLFFVYKFVVNAKSYKSLEQELKARNLK